MADDDRTLDANARKNLGQELCLRCCRPGRAPRPLAVAKAGPVDGDGAKRALSGGVQDAADAHVFGHHAVAVQEYDGPPRPAFDVVEAKAIDCDELAFRRVCLL